MTFDSFITIQRTLSHGQIVPLIGIIPSFPKLVVSAVQALWGTTEVTWGVLQLMTGFSNVQDENCIWDGLFNIASGGVGFSYAVGNICSLSLLGFFVENGFEGIKNIGRKR